jgi:hypothetical protein
MAIRPLNSIEGFSTGDPAITVVQANGDITTINLTANGLSNLGPVANVKITGGSNGQAITTDGAGNLVFSTINLEISAAPMPIVIDSGNTLTIAANYQGLFAVPLVVDGTLEVDGVLADVSGQGAAGTDTQVTFNDEGNPSGNNGFTFLKSSGNLNVPGSFNAGSFIKCATYSEVELRTITGVIGQLAAVNDSNPIGMPAFWDGTNNRWSYIHDNSAV